MDALTSLLSYIAPAWAANRLAGQARLKTAQRYYEAINLSSQRPRRGNNASADAVMDRARNYPREYGRWLDENHDLATGILDDLVTNIIGSGAGIEPMAILTGSREPALDLNRQLATLWAEFWEAPEVTGELPGPELERLVCRSWLRDGEIFAQHVIKATAPFSTRIPYALELLEADFVPFDLLDPARLVVHGVQKDGWGRPVGYYVLRQHPGSLRPGATMDTVWLPAERAMHLKFARRLHQTRGISIFHAVLTRLDDLKDYEESERIKARVAAALTAFVKRDPILADGLTDTNTEGTRVLQMEPGIIFDTLKPGEDIGVIDTKMPNPNLPQFRSAMLRAVAAGTGTRFSSIAKDYNGTYSAQRQELVEAVAHYRRLFDYLRARFYLPVWRRFLDASRLTGLVRIPAGIDEASLYRPEVRPPQMPWIDPKKEIDAFAAMVAAGFRSRQQVIRDLGGDPATVDAQLAADPLDIRPLPGDSSATAQTMAAEAAAAADSQDMNQQEAA